MASAYEQELEAEPTSVRAARRAVTDRLRSAVDQDQLDRIVLCTSEIVTNAIEHGAPPIELRVATTDGTRACRGPRHLAAAAPARRKPRPTSLRGRGLLIVERLRRPAGASRPRAVGKAVWFELAV